MNVSPQYLWVFILVLCSLFSPEKDLSTPRERQWQETGEIRAQVLATFPTKLVRLTETPPCAGSLTRSPFPLMVSVLGSPWGRDGAGISILQWGNWLRLHVSWLVGLEIGRTQVFRKFPNHIFTLNPLPAFRFLYLPTNWFHQDVSQAPPHVKNGLVILHLNTSKNGLVILHPTMAHSACQFTKSTTRTQLPIQKSGFHP